ncbi:MAG: peroxide stress protein YaaA [Eubacteriales bacterium]|nr:peroxide stress protein YaaA [Eubacteriales bacterium]
MKLIISPAKKMIEDPDTFRMEGSPVFIEETEILMRAVQALSFAEAKALWRCNDRLAELNFERFRQMDLSRGTTPALIAYEGIQYQYLAPKTLEAEALSWLSEHLFILSGFYGILRPFDGVVPYRLEMQAALKTGKAKDLYGFWGNRIYKFLTGENRPASGREQEPEPVINLASKEYAKAVEPYLTKEDRYISCVFAERAAGKLRQKATLAKMARGEMVRFLAERRAEDPEEMKAFAGLGFAFSEADSDEKTFVFVKEAE